MGKKSGRLVWAVLMIALLVALPLPYGCAEEEEGEVTREIIIGILLDFSGPAGDQGRRMHTFWKDSIRYTNEEDPIEDAWGNRVTLKTLAYDNQYDPGRTIIGYKSLLDQGAMIIMACYDHEGEILKPNLEEDEVPMYLDGPSEKVLFPPG